MTQTMPELVDRIDADLRQAMRDRNQAAKLALRAVKTALIEVSTSGEQAHVLSEEEVMAVLQREAKRRREAADEFERLGDPVRAAAEREELAVLETYLPRQMSEEEIEAVARRVIAEVGAVSAKQMGAVMAALMNELKNKADGKTVNQVVRRLLSN